MKKLFVFVFASLLTFTCIVSGEKFYPDDPVWQDDDRIAAPKPVEITQSELYDFVINSFGDPAKGKDQPAKNLNTLGEVPDSSWFTNRIGMHPMSNEELVRGANRSNGPDMSLPWIVTKVKTQGVQAGFTIHDSRGDTYFIKFDPGFHPQLTTSAEVVASKFFYAFGYNVPENYVMRIRRTQIQVGPQAQIADENGKKRHLRESDLDHLLKKAPQWTDGSYQAIASLLIPGQSVGSFKYYGVRTDDANDIVPHEDRRELRGMRVFSGWLQDFDRRFINSKDMYIADGSYVKHYLLDFGSTLGSGGVPPIQKRMGHEYKIEGHPILKASATLGLWDRDWRHYKYPKYPGIGTIEADHYRPEKWKPGYPNPAFDRMQNTDAFWATRIVMQFTDDQIRAIVHTGQWASPDAEKYMADTLIGRRDRIVQYYLAQLNPLADFEVGENRTLHFKNLGVQHGLTNNATYEYQWFRFDNQTSKTAALGATRKTGDTALAIPEDSSAYLMVRIRTLSPNQPKWHKTVDTYVRTADNKVVGIDREN